jgi:hypothetical protein
VVVERRVAVPNSADCQLPVTLRWLFRESIEQTVIVPSCPRCGGVHKDHGADGGFGIAPQRYSWRYFRGEENCHGQNRTILAPDARRRAR